MQRFLSLFLLAATTLVTTSLQAQRTEILLRDGWRFHRGEAAGAEQPAFDDNKWERVSVPHDWAIKGPFGSEHDLQNVAVTQNGEKEATLKTGRTGGLPYIGVGWYRTSFIIDDLGLKNDEYSQQSSIINHQSSIINHQSQKMLPSSLTAR